MKVDKTKWEKKTLGEICYIYDSQRKPVSKENRIKGIYPYYGATGLQDYVHDYIFDGRYLLLGEDGGKWNAKENSAYIVEGKIWVNNHAHILQFKNNIIDSYICYYLNYSDLMEYITGSIVPKLTQAKMRKIEIPIPPLTEQRAIVAELDAVQKMIEGYKAQLADLDTLAQSIFLDMFGDPITNPKGWEKEPIHNSCKIIRGPFGGSLKKECFVPTGFAVYEQQNAIYNTFSFRYFIDEQKFNELKRFSVIPNDLIMSCAGTMGKIAIVPQTAPKGIINQALMKISIIKDLNVIYLKFLMESSLFQDSIENQAKGVAMKNVAAVRTIKNVLIPVPPLPLQQQFAERVEAIERQKELLQAQLAEAQTLMAERMQYYFD